MERIKEIWENRKTRGIIFLVLYVLLFSYIFIVYGNKTEKIILPENKPIKEEKPKEINSYEYEYIIGEETIDIIKNNDTLNFKKDDIDYYYINQKYYKLEEEKFYEVENPLKYNFDYYNKLEEIKKISTFVKTSKYANGNVEDNYDVNMAQFLDVFGIKEEVDAKDMLNYSTIKVDDKVVEIDFNTLDFKIKYKSFKNIPEINTNYEFYVEPIESEIEE